MPAPAGNGPASRSRIWSAASSCSILSTRLPSSSRRPSSEPPPAATTPGERLGVRRDRRPPACRPAPRRARRGRPRPPGPPRPAGRSAPRRGRPASGRASEKPVPGPIGGPERAHRDPGPGPRRTGTEHPAPARHAASYSGTCRRNRHARTPSPAATVRLPPPHHRAVISSPTVCSACAVSLSRRVARRPNDRSGAFAASGVSRQPTL